MQANGHPPRRGGVINSEAIVRAILQRYPTTQGIYLFGSYGTDDEWPGSDVDIAILLPPGEAKRIHPTAIGDLKTTLEDLIGKQVDLINLRQVSTVFQKEIIMAGRRFYDCGAADEFEVRVLGDYQKLNEERGELLAEGLRSGRFYGV